MTHSINFIKNFHPFNQLSQTKLDQISTSLTIEAYQQSDKILTQNGPPSEYLYIIHTGAVRLVLDGQTVDILEAGELFGYPSLINQAPPQFDALVEGYTYIYNLPAKIFLKLMEDNPKFAQFFSKGLVDRLQQATRLEASVLGGNLTLDVSTLTTRPPIYIKPTATVGEAAKMMTETRVSSILVSVEPVAILTEYDLTRRVLAHGLGPDTPVRQVMTQPIKTMPGDTPLYSAMLYMLEEGIHRIPLTQDGRIIGMVSVTDLLRHQSTSPFYLAKKLQRLDTLETLHKYSFEVTRTVETLFHGGLHVTQIGRIVASVNDALIKQLLKLAEAELGPPPTPYAWLVFGSEGRMEQLLLTDQDNAIVYEDDTPEAASYFAKLSEKINDGLITAGFPPCPGGYMATNWCKPLAKWTHLFEQWIQVPNAQALLEAAIFFDFRAVHGDLSVKPLDDILLTAKEQRLFLAQLAKSALEFTPPLGFFKRIKKDNQGRIDLKRAGIAPIVSIARVYGLESGTFFPSTIERLETAATNKALSKEGASTLIEAFRFLLELRLETQLKVSKKGELPTNKVIWDDLSPVDRRHLKESFIAIRDYQSYLSERFYTGMLG